jgi:hypothetical protein
MNLRLMAAILAAGQLLVSTSPLLAQPEYSRLSRAEKRAYHACLYAHWIDTYCRFHAWAYNGESSVRDCIIANGACGCVIADDEYWRSEVDDACRSLYSARRR